MAFTLSELRKAVREAVEPEAWADRLSMIADERQQIEQFVDTGGQAYGFTTLFGHLDAIQREREAIANLYRGHLVGNPEQLEPKIARGIIAVKLCQLSNGGTGISPASYERLRAGFSSDLEDIRVDLRASYGSGDVVPGAWLVDSLFRSFENLHRGDLMALINGSYMPTGVLLGAMDELESVAARALGLVTEARSVSVQLQKQVDVQLPVSLRDLTPLQHALQHAQGQLEAALLQAVNRQSGNPLFRFDDGAHPVSNSSFLDFQLTSALSVAHEMLLVLAAYITSAIRWVSGLAETTADELDRPLFVQLPKVGKAYENQLVSNIPRAEYSQVESMGVEDVSDSALRRVLDLKDALPLLDKISDLLSQALRTM